MAKRLGLSSATISQVLAGKYGADTRRVEAIVRGELLGEVVNCPVVGELNRRRCCEYQSMGFAATNPIRVKLFRGCRSGCKFSFLENEYGGEEAID